MRIIFAGTPDFAATALAALHEAGHDVALVLTQPDRRAGRGLQTTPSAVKSLALRLNLPVAQPVSLRDAAAEATIAAVQADAMVVAAYGLLLPPSIVRLPRLGCLNIHASLLPRWRGAAPIQRAILAGDAQTGVTIMQMDEGLDTGAILLRDTVDVTDEDTAQTLTERLARLGARLIVEALAQPARPVAQDGASATYAAKVDKREARIDWRESAQANARKVRAFNPAPGASTVLRHTPLKIWGARVLPDMTAEPGVVQSADASGITVSCGTGALRISELQRAGGRRVPVSAFLAGFPVTPGERLDDH